MNNNLSVLIDSLDLKIAVLNDIEKYNEEQRAVFESDNPKIDDFDAAIEKKGELIERLEKLDEGFELLYTKIADDIRENKAKYSLEINTIQQKITEITELSMSVQASEARNKVLIEQYFSRERKNIKMGRVGSRVAFDYYRNMSGMSSAGPQFVDSKN